MRDGYKARVRGIYTTALTRFLIDRDFKIVQPSDYIVERFGSNFSEENPDLNIRDRHDLQGIEAVGDKTPEMMLNGQDRLNLLMILLPILLILMLLITPKEAVGCGIFGTLLGVERSGEGAACVAESLPFLLQIIQILEEEHP